MVAPEDFFCWLMVETEAQWEARPSERFPDWTARWRDGLSDAEIDDCEKRYGVRFPAAYRVMLSVMGGTTSRRRGNTSTIVEPDAPNIEGWFDLRFDEAVVLGVNSRLPSRLWPEVADSPGSGYAWPRTFGLDPGSRPARLDAIAQWLERAPRAWPLVGHRFLILDESIGMAPVLSIWHSNDTIVYGDCLEMFLLRQLGVVPPSGLLELPETPSNPRALPYWGDLL